MSEPVPWTELEQHFDHVLELDPGAREPWLASMTATQPEIVAEIRARLRKLEALDAAGFMVSSPYTASGTPAAELSDFLKQQGVHETGNPGSCAHGAQAPPPAQLVAGAIVGSYRLIREIGYGGMSVVWLAERCDGQLKREVALKLPLTGPRMQVERFMLERDILASLTHPNIARLYDAGITESRQPYLAMEYVAGTALTHSSDERRLTVEIGRASCRERV